MAEPPILPANYGSSRTHWLRCVDPLDVLGVDPHIRLCQGLCQRAARPVAYCRHMPDDGGGDAEELYPPSAHDKAQSCQALVR